MAVAYITYGVSDGTYSTSCVITKPVGLSAGNLMLAHIAWGDNTSIASDGTWNIIGNINGQGTNNLRGAMFWKIATAADVAASNFTFTSDIAYSKGVITSWSGTDPDAPLSAYACSTYETSNICSFPSITQGEANNVIVLATSVEHLLENIDYWGIEHSSPDFTQIYNLEDSYRPDVSVAMAYGVRPETTHTGLGYMANDNGVYQVGFTLAIRAPDESSSSSESPSSESSSSSTFRKTSSSSSVSSESSSSSTFKKTSSSSSSTWRKSSSSSSKSSQSGGDFCSVYPPEQTSTYVKGYSIVEGGYEPYICTDPTKSLIGTSVGNSWITEWGSSQNHKLNIDLGSSYVIQQIYYENYHNSGTGTWYGMKDYIFYGTNSATAFANLTFGTTTDLTELASGTFDEHTASNVADPKYISVSNTTSYRYYVFRFSYNWGGSEVMALRRVELQQPCNISSSSSSSKSSDSSSSTSSKSTDSSSSSSKSSDSSSSKSTDSSSSSSKSSDSSSSSSSKSSLSSESSSSSPSTISSSSDSSLSSLSSISSSSSPSTISSSSESSSSSPSTISSSSESSSSSPSTISSSSDSSISSSSSPSTISSSSESSSSSPSTISSSSESSSSSPSTISSSSESSSSSPSTISSSSDSSSSSESSISSLSSSSTISSSSESSSSSPSTISSSSDSSSSDSSTSTEIRSSSSSSSESSSSNSSSSSTEHVFELIGYLCCEINGSDTKNHYLPIYYHTAAGSTPSNRDFWGDLVASPTNLVEAGFISNTINSTTKWLHVYIADPSSSCCTNIQGVWRPV